MNIDIHAENIELNAPLRTFIEEKMSDLDRTVSRLGEYSARVEVGIPSQHHNTGPIFYAEVNLKTPSHLFRAEATHHDLHAAIVDVKDDLKNQIAKFKDRLREEHRQAPEL
jgi:putative sigma-54 modulation protein